MKITIAIPLVALASGCGVELTPIAPRTPPPPTAPARLTELEAREICYSEYSFTRRGVPDDEAFLDLLFVIVRGDRRNGFSEASELNSVWDDCLEVNRIARGSGFNIDASGCFPCNQAVIEAVYGE